MVTPQSIHLTHHFLIFDIRALWRSVLSAREPECQKLKNGGLEQYGPGVDALRCNHLAPLGFKGLRIPNVDTIISVLFCCWSQPSQPRVLAVLWATFDYIITRISLLCFWPRHFVSLQFRIFPAYTSLVTSQLRPHQTPRLCLWT